MRIGHGFDVHRFGPRQPGGTSVRLGGVDVPHDAPLVAHSDGDVLLHALADALLGAAGLGDIGHHFPDDDPAWENADSTRLLALVLEAVHRGGWQVGNVDLTLIAQAPRVATHIPRMREVIASVLGVSADQVNVKATTTERLGYIGEGAGVAAHAVALLVAEPRP